MFERFPTYYEFFAGGGMARAGLGDEWRCLFANDFDCMKAAAYIANWGGDHFLCEDIGKLTVPDLPGRADLAWASFPCQDLSLAGDGAGLGTSTDSATTRSGTFWPFLALMHGLRHEGRAPRMIVLENVFGALTSHGGKDFVAIGEALSTAGYQFGAVVIDAACFVPQSRPRVFFVAVESGSHLPPRVVHGGPSRLWHPKALTSAYSGLSAAAKSRWVWWDLPVPSDAVTVLADLIEDKPAGVAWHSNDETGRLLGMMSPLNQAKVEAAQRAGRRVIGCIYRRTRPDADGSRRQRAEVRFDGVAGCLRTPGGGSSRQTILLVDADKITSRLLSAREAARLMGLSDGYILPARYNAAYHVAGDGVCPPVVRHLARYLLEPVLAACVPIAIAAE